MLLEEVQSYSNLEFLARKAKEGFITGMHNSPFHGFSVEFAEHRPYNPGESIKHLDWKLLARTDKKYIKQFNEETNLRSYFWMDVSKSMYYPAQSPYKMKFEALTVGALSLIFQQQKDAFSLQLFNENGFFFKQNCKSTQAHWHQLIQELQLYWQANQRELQQVESNDVHISMEEMALQVHQRSLVIIFSDLLWDESKADEQQQQFWKSLALLQFKKCEVIVFHVFHRLEEIELNLENRPTKFIDLESGDTLKLQPSEFQMLYQKTQEHWLVTMKDKLLQLGVRYIPSDVSMPIEQVLKSFFNRR